MKLLLKTIKNEVFELDVEPTQTIGVIKTALAVQREDFPADRTSLIHVGKVLKDDQTLSELNLKEKDSLVCICKKAAPAPAPAAVAVAASAQPTTTSGTSTTNPAPAAAITTPAPAAQPARTNPNPGAVADLMAMTGASADMVEQALIAANGSADLAFDFLLGNARPAPAQQRHMPASSSPSQQAPAPATPAQPLDKLRRHPQFPQLQRLCQSNPAAIPQVLKIIGDQDPDLLAIIHANNDAFIQMMQEPIGSVPTPAAPAQQQRSPPIGGMGGMGMMPPGGMNQAFAQMANLPAAQRNVLAQQMGMPPAQLEQMLAAFAQMPPEQLAQMGAMGGMGGNPGGAQPGQVRVEMSPADMENVRNIMGMTGMSQAEVVQAYIACERDPDNTINLLLDGGYRDEEGGYDGGAYGDQGDEGGDDDMYG